MIETIKNLLNKMDVEIEDYVSVILTLCLLAIWYLTLSFLDTPLISILILWTGMIMLSIIYSYIYKKKNRNIRILRIRFFISALPIYPMLLYYLYQIIFNEKIPEQLQFTPVIVVFLMLLLNALVVYYYRNGCPIIKKNN